MTALRTRNKPAGPWRRGSSYLGRAMTEAHPLVGKDNDLETANGKGHVALLHELPGVATRRRLRRGAPPAAQGADVPRVQSQERPWRMPGRAQARQAVTRRGSST